MVGRDLDIKTNYVIIKRHFDNTGLLVKTITEKLCMSRINT